MSRKVILYAVIGLIILGLIVMTLFPNIVYVFRDSGSSGLDKCKPPAGKSEAEWQTHMSHHPEIYKECFE